MAIPKYLKIQRNYPLFLRYNVIVLFNSSLNVTLSDQFRTVLVEVTSSRKLADCKLVLDTLLSEMVALQGGRLKVVQGRVVGEEGELRVTYPSKTDLVEVEGLSVVRD